MLPPFRKSTVHLQKQMPKKKKKEKKCKENANMGVLHSSEQ